MSTDAGRKDDTGKLPLDLLAFDALEGTASVLQFGAAKYAPRNWEKGIAYSRVFAALMRHMWWWWKGQDKDPETGLNHLHHAACCIMFLQAYTIRKRKLPKELDNRPSKLQLTSRSNKI
jgi:hypothetical protein